MVMCMDTVALIETENKCRKKEKTLTESKMKNLRKKKKEHYHTGRAISEAIPTSNQNGLAWNAYGLPKLEWNAHC